MLSPNKVTIQTSLIVPIVGDAAIAGPVAEGKLITVLIVDVSGHAPVGEAIRVHRHLSAPGDVDSQWAGSRDSDDHVLLHLSLMRPLAVDFYLRFSIEHQAILVESMLVAGAVYLQAGSPGDRLMTTLERDRLLVELPDTGFRPYWDELLLKRMTAVMSSRLGVPRRKGRDAAMEVIAKMREFVGFRHPAGT